MAALAGAVLVSACASGPPYPVSHFPELKGFEDDSKVPPVLPAEDILAVNDDMRAFLDRYVSRRGSNERKVQQLTQAILHPGTLGVTYRDYMTRTAAETFDTANGNCLSLSMLFVSMARELGLEATFYEVKVVPEWTMAGDVVFASRHVNVGGRIRTGDTYVMDFSPYIIRRQIGRRRMTDEQAIAHFYNNIGANHLTRGELQAAHRNFIAGVQRAPDVAFLWSNLSVAYSRNGQLDAAELALENAITLDPNDTSAMTNLAALLRAQGKHEEAEVLSTRVASAQRRNPYYQYGMGERHLAAHRYEEALARMQSAIELEPGESIFYRKAAIAASELGELSLANEYATLASALDAEVDRRSGHISTRDAIRRSERWIRQR